MDALPLADGHAAALGHLLAAVDLAVHGIVEVAVVGDRPDLVAEVRAGYRPCLLYTSRCV